MKVVGEKLNGRRKNGGRMKGLNGFITKRCKMTLKTTHRTNIDNLDDYLLTEILIRLPSETILVAKIISKRWYSLISHPSFLNNHTRLQTEQRTFFSNHLNLDLTRNKKFYGTIGQLSFDLSSSLLHFSENSLLVVRESEKMEVMVLASCHGLLLTFLKKTGCGNFCIFNPLTKKKRIIPHNKENRFTGCGFAFGAKSSSSSAAPAPPAPPGGGSNYYYYYNHFNVVCVVPRETAFVFKIFSPETGTWRDSNTILKYPKGLDNTTGAGMAVCLRGVVYWLTSYEYIIAFDVVKEESRIIEAPKSVSKRVSASRIIKPKGWLWSFWLGVIGDELNYVVVNPDFEIEFWILHDYYEWKLKRKEVMKNKKNFPRAIILCDGERLFFQAEFQGYHVVDLSYVYNIRTGVSRRSAFRWGSWFPCVSTLAEV